MSYNNSSLKLKDHTQHSNDNDDSDNEYSKKAETVLNSEANLSDKSVRSGQSQLSNFTQNNKNRNSNTSSAKKIKSKSNSKNGTSNNFNKQINLNQNNKTDTLFLPHSINTNLPMYNNLNDIDSRKLKEPIINKSTFFKSLSKDIDNSHKLQLKLFEYTILKEIIDSCGSFPEKFRNYVWKFLLSLPNNKNLFEMFSIKGIHPFYRNLDQVFPVQDIKIFRKLQHMCSALTFWSPHVGNVYFLPNLIFPFIKCINGDDLFLFELIISFLNTYAQYWFEFYPGAPLNHLKLCEKIIEKENPKIYQHLKKLEIEENLICLKLSEIIWRMFKNNFSESLIKENWLQYMDFILTYSHKPEILFYFACSYLIKKENLILKCKNKEDIENILFNSRCEKNSNLNFLNVFAFSIKLLEKYSKYQLYLYYPHLPMCDIDRYGYPSIDKFPLDFLETTSKLREDLFRDTENFKTKQDGVNEIEEKFMELSKKEEMMQRAYECLVHREKEKGEIIKKELDLILYQKTKFYDEIKLKKLDKIDRLNKLIDKSLKFYDNMNSNEINHFEEEMRKRKVLEEHDIKHRLQQEELNNLEFDANRKMINLLNLRNKDEENRKFKTQDEIRNKEKDVNKKLLEERWKLEDNEFIQKVDMLRNMKEYELIKKKESNELLNKEYNQKINDYDENLLINQVERERKSRQIDCQIEMNKMMIDTQSEKRNQNLKKEEENEFVKITNKEFENFKNRKTNHNEILLNKMKENLYLINDEEKYLVDYEQKLKKKEIENKFDEIRKKGEINAVQDEKFFQDQFMKLEEQMRIHLLKKEEVEMNKQNLIQNINNVLDEMRNINNNPNNVINSQKQNFENYKSMYNNETMEKINNIRNTGSYENNLINSELSDYIEENSLPMTRSMQKEKEKGNIQFINQGIRNLASQNKNKENIVDTNNYNTSIAFKNNSNTNNPKNLNNHANNQYNSEYENGPGSNYYNSGSNYYPNYASNSNLGNTNRFSEGYNSNLENEGLDRKTQGNSGLNNNFSNNFKSNSKNNLVNSNNNQMYSSENYSSDNIIRNKEKIQNNNQQNNNYKYKHEINDINSLGGSLTLSADSR